MRAIYGAAQRANLPKLANHFVHTVGIIEGERKGFSTQQGMCPVIGIEHCQLKIVLKKLDGRYLTVAYLPPIKKYITHTFICIIR